MKRRNGFTLIEVLAVIIIIGVISIIAVPIVINYLNSARETAYTSFEKSMEEAAKGIVLDCINENNNCQIKMDNKKIYLNTLIEDELIENIKDPSGTNFCEEYTSYVNIIGDNPMEYKYEACLYCGTYITDNTKCEK